MGFRTLLTVALAVGLVSGCATAKLTTEEREDLGSVRVAPIDIQKVAFTGAIPSQYDTEAGNGMYGSIWTMPFGVIYDVCTYATKRQNRARALERVLAHRNIDVPKAIQDQFIKQLEATHFFDSVVEVMPPSMDFDEEKTGEMKDPIGEPGEVPASLPVSESPATATPAPAVGGGLLPTIPDADGEFQLQVSYGVGSVSMIGDAFTPWIKLTGTLRNEKGRMLWRHTVRVDSRNGQVPELPWPDPFRDTKRAQKTFRKAVKLAVYDLMRHMAGIEDKR